MRHTLMAAGLLTLGVLAGPLSGADDKDKAGSKDNTPPEGFTALFNGKDLQNWQADDKVKQHWKVVDGILVFDGRGGNLKTAKKDYKNFVFHVDWKIGKGADSGIYIRGAPQVQIWDNPEGSGGLWNDQNKPTKKADKPIGEWNHFEITVEKGNVVSVVLNGEKVVDKFTKKNLPPMGTIELQDHGNPLWFKNIYVKELPE
jgi:hypothetical protein